MKLQLIDRHSLTVSERCQRTCSCPNATILKVSLWACSSQIYGENSLNCSTADVTLLMSVNQLLPTIPTSCMPARLPSDTHRYLILTDGAYVRRPARGCYWNRRCEGLRGRRSCWLVTVTLICASQLSNLHTHLRWRWFAWNGIQLFLQVSHPSEFFSNLPQSCGARLQILLQPLPIWPLKSHLGAVLEATYDQQAAHHHEENQFGSELQQVALWF
mmetsp:Transcript_48028/g.88441  ORF Transcript_48028/g.88441 Transcript_48028/m.88441 type:complete len:216 (-) Transcript_48028:1451-2098(-)